MGANDQRVRARVLTGVTPQSAKRGRQAPPQHTSVLCLFEWFTQRSSPLGAVYLNDVFSSRSNISIRAREAMVGPSIRIKPAGEPSKASTADGGETSHRLISFLLSQPQSTMNRLYQKPSSCLSIFRSIPPSHVITWRSSLTMLPNPRLLQPLERQVVMNLLWLETPIPGATMAAWVTREGKR